MSTGNQELLRTRCHLGWLIITDAVVRIERQGIGSMGQLAQVLPRQQIVGATAVVTMPPIFGKGGSTTVTITGQGTMVLEAKTVNPSDARRALELLGYA